MQAGYDGVFYHAKFSKAERKRTQALRAELRSAVRLGQIARKLRRETVQKLATLAAYERAKTAASPAAIKLVREFHKEVCATRRAEKLAAKAAKKAGKESCQEAV